MAVSETIEVAVMEVWLIDSPDPKINTSWATWCSLFGMGGAGQKA